MTDDRSRIRALHRAPEQEVLRPLMEAARLPPPVAERVQQRARDLVRQARIVHRPGADVSDFLGEYRLNTREGVALMCLAEALLRIPDTKTADALIDDLLRAADWQGHIGHANSLAVNAASWAFMLTGRVLGLDDVQGGVIAHTIRHVVQRAGEPIIRTALHHAMRVLARQFVMGRTMDEALKRATSAEGKRWRFSFDMLGEAARTSADAARYFDAYSDSIAAVAPIGGGPVASPGISVKLSALHPRYEPLQEDRCIPALIESLTALALQAKAVDIGLTVDAEEADRLEITLDIFAAVLADPRLAGWDGLGLAVQAYQKRAIPVVDWIAALGARTGHRVPVRLVKGAYWDTEIKLTQQFGYDDYPVFTRKAATDVSWIACARRMIEHRATVRPVFATHNAHSLAVILEIAGDSDFEMQRLHGMGEPLYEDIAGPACPVRVYAPVGSLEDLLAYLVRRLLENGANTSFVHRLADPTVPEDTIVADPVVRLQAIGATPNPRLPPPAALYPDRRNSKGLDLADRALAPAIVQGLHAERAPRDLPGAGLVREVRDPSDRRRLIGTVPDATEVEIDAALQAVTTGWRAWDELGGDARASVLERAADLIEGAREELLFLLAREAGRTLTDGIAEVREAVDFCRWYAAQARMQFGMPRELPGPTGERNVWSLRGRGVFACISPWNFPLSIFVGQVAAALAAGNAVVAKPAEQTPLIADRATALLHAAGVPRNVLRCLPGDGTVGATLTRDARIAGVAFTGGTDTARVIARALADRPGPIVPLIAETGGINAMIVDSSALPEQVVGDVLISAFGSAGQRCSSLRLLCLQEEIADKVLVMLRGAAEMLSIGDPLDPATDIGPIIDADALAALTAYAQDMGSPLFELALPAGTEHGTFFAPRAFAVPGPSAVSREIFGPVLHVVRFNADQLNALLDEISSNGFGLTLSMHSRIEATQRHIAERLRVGNVYVNRNQIGAVVGVQPFGGRGLSGTGPKAGGPITLFRYAEERSLSVNMAAVGGNAALLAPEDDGPD